MYCIGYSPYNTECWIALHKHKQGGFVRERSHHKHRRMMWNEQHINIESTQLGSKQGDLVSQVMALVSSKT